ncbi:MAG TPA: hypothetical protein VJY33_26680, partial [Isosphaeraceae bacterium]|nr:hypothetical protein [Isosphaeraceae bacterium]
PGGQAGYGNDTSTLLLMTTPRIIINEEEEQMLAGRDRPFWDLAVEEVAVVGSDPFIREGSDVTILFRCKHPAFFKARLTGFLDRAAQTRPDACRSHGEYRGIPYDHLETADREICVYSASPAKHICVRSNSLAAFQHVIDAILGTTREGKPVVRLGDTAEFAYIRTIYPLGAEEEDGLIYLSDPFIRRLVGPKLKLTERRRMHCYNHLRMIGHAAMLYRTEHGRPADSLQTLYESGCLPCPFCGETAERMKNEIAPLVTLLESSSPDLQEHAAAELEKLGPCCRPELLARLADQPPLDVAMRIESVLANLGDEDSVCCCPDGGAYRLSADGMSGECTLHGHAHFLTPNLEIPLDTVSGAEASEYRAFLEDYNHYWRTYFDPIAIRVQATPHRYRLETLVLPLIDNSIYTGLAAVLGGQAENLDAGPVPKRNIFSMAFRLNKEALLKDIAEEVPNELPARVEAEDVPEETPPPQQEAEAVYPVPVYAPRETPSVNGTCRTLLKDLGVPETELEKDKLDVEKFFKQGIGSQIGLHLYDAPPNFDFNLSTALGLLGQLSARSSGSISLSDLASWWEVLLLGGVGASLNGPVYFSIPVQDAKVVDEFGDQLERIFAHATRQSEAAFHGLGGTDFYRMPFKNDPTRMMRVFTVRVGPVKLRYFWARIGSIVYLATQPCVLDDLLALECQPVPSTEANQPAHALVTIRARNWNEVLDNTYLGWGEN